VLQSTRLLLQKGDHDYRGHRLNALKAIDVAEGELRTALSKYGKNIPPAAPGKSGAGKEPRKTSDAQLSHALKQVESTITQLANANYDYFGHRYKAVVALEGAVKQLQACYQHWQVRYVDSSPTNCPVCQAIAVVTVCRQRMDIPRRNDPMKYLLVVIPLAILAQVTVQRPVVGQVANLPAAGNNGPHKDPRKVAKHGFVLHVHGGAKYTVFVPHSYNFKGTMHFPLILFLHGKGERGVDGVRPAKVGLGEHIMRTQKTFPFFAVFPQCRPNGLWAAGSPDGQRALAILDAVEKRYRVDRKRVYLTGLSLGGAGTWSLGEAHAHRWAAIVPVCGVLGERVRGPILAQAGKLKDMPCWCFHGGTDPTVTGSREMIKLLQAAGGHPIYTEYPGVGHQGCWEPAYATAKLYPWLLSHKK
jgi:poly(3-hydroxybutyrate) depolymerase